MRNFKEIGIKRYLIFVFRLFISKFHTNSAFLIVFRKKITKLFQHDNQSAGSRNKKRIRKEIMFYKSKKKKRKRRLTFLKHKTRKRRKKG